MKMRRMFVIVVALAWLTSTSQGLDWPWNWKREDVTCYGACLAAVGTGAVVGTPFAIAAAGFGSAGVVAGSLAAKLMSMVGVVKAGSWLAFLQSAGVAGVGTTGKMIVASTVAPLCAAICGNSDEIRQDLKCFTVKHEGMKGLDDHILRAEHSNNLNHCESMCNDEPICLAFRFLPKNQFCFLYRVQQFIEDDVESQFFTKQCILCYMNTTDNTKGRDDEVQAVTKVSSLAECENSCIKSDYCQAVYFHGNLCYILGKKGEQQVKDGYKYSAKICVKFHDIALEYKDDQ